MAVVIGTEQADDLRGPDNQTNTFFGLGGDDTYIGGNALDIIHGGPGADYLSGGPTSDIYHYISSYESIYIDEYESNGINTNRFDRLNLYTNAIVINQIQYAPREIFGLEFIVDSYVVREGETSDLARPGPGRVDTNAFIQTTTGVIEIFDQYGNFGSNGQAGDEQDGIEFIEIKFVNRFNSETTRSFQISDEFQIFTGTQRGKNNDNEFFFGTRGVDTIFGNGGDDLIMTGDGNDVVFGGSGSDHIIASRGDNFLDGGDSGDFYYWNSAYSANNVIQESSTGSEDSLITSFAVEDLGGVEMTGSGPIRDLRLFLFSGADPTQVTSSFLIRNQFSTATDNEGIEFIRFADTWYDTQTDFSRIGGPGNDFIVAPGDAGRRYAGRSGDDAIFAGNGRDVMLGGPGDDLLSGGGGRDVLRGEGGNDILRGGPGADQLFGGPGFDIADYRFSGSGVTVNLDTGRGTGGEAQGDRLSLIEGVVGSSFNDTLIGDIRDNLLLGRGGDDVIRGGRGDDEIDGGAGNDRIWGGGERDQIRGSLGNDRLWGDAGDDSIWGGAGADQIWGGTGNDRLWGGSGRDIFHFANGHGRDRIFDFTDGQDRIAFASGPQNFAQLDISQSGANAVINYGGGTIILVGFDANLLDRSDFIF